MASAGTAWQSAPVELPTTRIHPFDPAPELRRLREEQPLCRLRYPDGHVGWLVTTYALAREVLVDPRFTVRLAAQRPPAGDPSVAAEFDEAFRGLPEQAGVLMSLDPPRHARMRRAVASYFAVRSVQSHSASVERIVDERLDALEAAGKPVDLVRAFALPVASLTICELLGAPAEDREQFERPSAVIEDTEASSNQKIEAVQGFLSFCRELLQRKRDDPADDLLSDLIARGELTEEEMVGVAMQLFEAGHETTASMISLSVLVLLNDRDRWRALCEEPDHVGSAVEELLRYLTILQMGAFTRTAVEDLELDGVTIAAGESVTVSLAAANRDPDRFDDPDELSLFGDATGHLAFGHGRHMCIGQHLARLELTIALRALLARLPTLRLAVSIDELSFHPGEHPLYAVDELLVTWDEAR
jgi:cytochrome P450